MTQEELKLALTILKLEGAKWESPYMKQLSQKRRDPFRILLATILSARTKDEVTREATRRLFKLAHNPKEMSKLRENEVARAIYPVGFYRQKAKKVIAVSKILVEKYRGKVPQALTQLLALPGVGRKTANLVLTLAFNKPAICVDTHVHRITNRWGYVKTKTPEETEYALREKLPLKYWLDINHLLVRWGQNICHPVSPKCSECPIAKFCAKVGVEKRR